MKPTQMEIHREWKMVVQPSFPKPTFPLEDFDPSNMVEYDTLKWPPWLQKNIMHFRDRFVEKHPNVIPNILILQDSYLVSAQFDDYVLRMNPDDRPESFKKKFRELYEKLEEWQGQMLFEW